MEACGERKSSAVVYEGALPTGKSVRFSGGELRVPISGTGAGSRCPRGRAAWAASGLHSCSGPRLSTPGAAPPRSRTALYVG